MVWSCKQCGLKLKKIVYPVHCVCGYIDSSGVVKQSFLPNGYIKWLSTAELVNRASVLAGQLPHNLSRVIGIPRSGMIPASVIATKLHLPLYSLIDGNIIEVGGGYRMKGSSLIKRDGLSVIVDDTICTGTRFKIELLKYNNDVLTLAIYSTGRFKVDYCSEIIPEPHLLEWNLFNSGYCHRMALDLDGVICMNPPFSDTPLNLPRFQRVRAIITARYEKQREETVEWLKKWGVQYSELFMYPYNNNMDHEAVVNWKAQKCKDINIDFYVESEPSISDDMRKLDIRVLCISQGFLL